MAASPEMGESCTALPAGLGGPVSLPLANGSPMPPGRPSAVTRSGRAKREVEEGLLRPLTISAGRALRNGPYQGYGNRQTRETGGLGVQVKAGR